MFLHFEIPQRYPWSTVWKRRGKRHMINPRIPQIPNLNLKSKAPRKEKKEKVQM